MSLTTESTMAKEHDTRTMSIRVGIEALEAAKIAAAFKGVSVVEYATALLLEAANRDIEEGYKSRAQGPVPKTRKPKGN